MGHRCSSEQRLKDLRNGLLWRHLAIMVFTHPPNPFTSKTNSYLPFYACNQFKVQLHQACKQITEQYGNNLKTIMGEFSFSRPCRYTDSELIGSDPDLVPVINNPKTPGYLASLNKKLLKTHLPKDMHHFVDRAATMLYFSFLNRYGSDFLSHFEVANETIVQLFWELCRKDEYLESKVNELSNMLMS